MNKIKLEKGMLISPKYYPEWYVVVNIAYDLSKQQITLECICDHANNIYYFEPKEIEEYLTLSEIKNLGYGKPDRDFGKVDRREIPYQQINEIILGRQDDRFEGYKNDF